MRLFFAWVYAFVFVAVVIMVCYRVNVLKLWVCSSVNPFERR